MRLIKRDTEGKVTSLTRREHKTTQPATQHHFPHSFNSIQKGSFFSLKKSKIISDKNTASLILKLDFWVNVNFRAKTVLSLKKLKTVQCNPDFSTTEKSYVEQNFDFLICMRDLFPTLITHILVIGILMSWLKFWLVKMKTEDIYPRAEQNNFYITLKLGVKNKQKNQPNKKL